MPCEAQILCESTFSPSRAPERALQVAGTLKILLEAKSAVKRIMDHKSQIMSPSEKISRPQEAEVKSDTHIVARIMMVADGCRTCGTGTSVYVPSREALEVYAFCGLLMFSSSGTCYRFVFQEPYLITISTVMKPLLEQYGVQTQT